jgi:hypothetical protein
MSMRRDEAPMSMTRRLISSSLAIGLMAVSAYIISDPFDFVCTGRSFCFWINNMGWIGIVFCGLWLADDWGLLARRQGQVG